MFYINLKIKNKKLKIAIKQYILFSYIIILIFPLMTVSLHSENINLDKKIEINSNIKTYNIKTFLKHVKEYSKDLKLAKQELRIAKIYRKEALSTALPKIQLVLDYNRNLKENFLYIDFPDPKTGEIANQKFKINYKNSYGIQGVISQPLFSFKVGTALKAAKQYKKLTDFVYKATYNEIINVSKKVFYQALLLEKIWNVSQNSQLNAYENYLQMKKKYKFGQTSQFQLLQSKSYWQSSLPRTSQAKRNYELALSGLKILAGLNTNQNINLSGNFHSIPTIPQMSGLETILDRRPDYNALQLETEMRKTNIKNKKADLLPNLDLNLIYNFSSMSDKMVFEKINNSFIVNLKLSVPIFVGGYKRAQVQKAIIEMESSKIKLEKERDKFSSEIKDIFLRLKEAQIRIKSSKQTLITAKKAFNIAKITVENGLATQLDLKDARLMFDQAQLNSFAAVYDYLSAYFDWEKATCSIKNK